MTKTCLIAARELLSNAYAEELTYLIEAVGWQPINSVNLKPDVILFAGGGDINPSMYGERPGEHTQKANRVRDGSEIWHYQYTQILSEKTVWSVGICRGMQLLNVLNGGKLQQHVEDHGDHKHAVEYFGPNKKDTFGNVVNSYHHQMVIPPTNGKQKHHPYEVLVKTTGVLNDPEAIYFPNSSSIGVQWHPEWDMDGASYKLFKRIVDDYIDKEAA